MHLLQHLVDVDGVRLLSALSAFLVASADGFRLSGFLGSLGRYFGWHDDSMNISVEAAMSSAFIACLACAESRAVPCTHFSTNQKTRLCLSPVRLQSTARFSALA